MTMDTRIHINTPTNPERLFLHLLDILAADPEFVPSWEQADPGPWKTEPGPLRRGRATYEHTRKGETVYQRGTGKPLWEQKESEYQSTVGQGLGAILELTYAQDGPIRWLTPDDGEELDGSEGPMNEHLIAISFDTSYGYHDANGANCGDLHAFLIREVYHYLAAEPIHAVWMHEEEGTWHLLEDYAYRGDPDRSILNSVRPVGA